MSYNGKTKSIKEKYIFIINNTFVLMLIMVWLLLYPCSFKGGVLSPLFQQTGYKALLNLNIPHYWYC